MVRTPNAIREGRPRNDAMPPLPAIPDWPSVNEKSPDAERLRGLARDLSAADREAEASTTWPQHLWQVLEQGGATCWALPEHLGGDAPSRPLLVQRYATVAEGSLTAAFILTQHDAAIRRLAAARESRKAAMWMERVASRDVFPTVGISQLTTSRRHGDRAMTATEVPGGFVLNGTMPWVTAAERADLFVTGGVLDDGRQMLATVARGANGLVVREAFDLAALVGSRTSEVECHEVRIAHEDVLAGPSPDVMATPGLAGTGGLETSALALGQARAALTALAKTAEDRPDLLEPLAALSETWARTANNLIAAAEGGPDAPAPATVRGEANDLALRATQAHLTARKGSGFLKSDPAQRWARQALFFLVWSCPSPVANAAIRDLAGLCDT